VTEAVNGPTLEAWLKQSHPVSDGVAVVEQLADAVNLVHSEGGLHRALRPSNIKLLPDGSLKLTDPVGRDKDASSLYAVAYQAPEVLQGGAYSQKAEIYAAGLIFYEALSGQNPFRRGTVDGTSNAVLTVQPTHLGESRKEVPRDLSDAIMGCLEKDPEWRPKDLSYILEVVRAAGGARKVKAAPKRSASTRDTGTLSGLGARRSSPSRAPVFLAVGIVVVAAGGGAAWYLGLLGPSGPGRPSAPTTLAAPTTTAPPASMAEAPSPAAPASTAPPRPSPSTRAVAVDTPTTVPTTLAPARVEVPPTTLPAPPPTQVSRVEPAETLPARPTAPPVTAPPSTVAAAIVPLEPAALKNVVPRSLRKHTPSMLDVHGVGLRPDHKAIVFKGHDVAAGFSIMRQRLVGPTLLQVLLTVDDAVPPGAYALALADGEGKVTNTVRFEVAK
jgi:hypothetical protein